MRKKVKCPCCGKRLFTADTDTKGTILLTLVVVVLALKVQFDIKDIYLIISGFYFGTQATKE